MCDFVRLFALGALSAVLMIAQPRFPMRHLDDIGNLGNPYADDHRTSADLGGLARVSRQGEVLRFEGRDLAGKPWRLFLVGHGGIGWTGVWTADFDRNGRPDLLIGTHFPGNGRCIDRGEAVFLLFDAAGRPVPWMVSTMTPDAEKRPAPPAILVDANGDGRAEIVTTSCEYSDSRLRFGEDRLITGVYEARDARMVPLRNAPLAQYRNLAIASHRSGGPGFVNWLPTQPSTWPDQTNGSGAPPALRLNRIITAAAGCGGVNIPIENGRVITLREDPCDALGQNRAVYSDGRTRRGWPPAVIDSEGGRDIYVAGNDEALRRILNGNYPLKLLGDDAAPDWIWADATKPAPPTVVTSEIVTSQVMTNRLLIREATATEAANPFGHFVSRGANCFAFSRAPNGEPEALHSVTCPPLARLRGKGISGPLRLENHGAWEIVAQERRLRSFSGDGSKMSDHVFTPPSAAAELISAVEFRDGFLVQWRVPTGAFVAMHNENGSPITSLMGTGAIQGELFTSSGFAGITFLAWKNGRPFQLTSCSLAVSWTRQ